MSYIQMPNNIVCSQAHNILDNDIILVVLPPKSLEFTKSIVLILYELKTFLVIVPPFSEA